MLKFQHFYKCQLHIAEFTTKPFQTITKLNFLISVTGIHIYKLMISQKTKYVLLIKVIFI